MDKLEREFNYNIFLEVYGVESQLNMTIEEMSELTKEICKAMRNKLNIEAMIEEISDVEIMIEQIKLIYNISNENIETIKDFKIRRAIKNIEDVLYKESDL